MRVLQLILTRYCITQGTNFKRQTLQITTNAATMGVGEAKGGLLATQNNNLCLRNILRRQTTDSGITSSYLH